MKNWFGFRKKIFYTLTAVLVCLLFTNAQPAYAYNDTVLFGEEDEKQYVKAYKVPIELEAKVSTDFYAQNSYAATTPNLVSFFDYKGAYNVAYESGDDVVIQRHDGNGQLLSKIKIFKKYPLWGNVIADGNGYYYLVFGQNDASGINCVVTCAAKYDYDGNYIASCEIKGLDSKPYGDDSFGTKLPFRSGTCSLAISKGILACNYARQMYNGHQSNYVFYVDCDSMSRLSASSVPYCSHSFDQRSLATSDGGFLFLDHGDAYYRCFIASKVNSAQNYVKNAHIFHFREGANRDHGYNETYAQLGGAVETTNAYVVCAASERTLSFDVAPTDRSYLGHSEARDLFLQILKKDFYNYSGANMYYVKGATRYGVGTRPASSNTELWLQGNETDYGVKWLTNYSEKYYAGNPQIVSISGDRFALLWEKTSYLDNDREVFCAVLNGNGEFVMGPGAVPSVKLAGNTTPVYRDGKLWWTVASGDGSGEICSIDIGSGSFEQAILPEKVTLDQTTAEFWAGDGVTLTATVTPENATYKDVIWSSNSSGVSVDQNGRVTAKYSGTAKITATLADGRGISATCDITVKQPIASITISSDSLALSVGDTRSLWVNVAPSYATDNSVIWKSSDTNVVTVEKNGRLTATGVGSATVTVTAADGSGKSASCVVTVTEVKVVDIWVDSRSLSLEQGKSAVLNVVITPSDATNKSIKWESSDTSVAVVDGDGLSAKVTAKAAGTATITATAEGGNKKSTSCAVTVKGSSTSGNGTNTGGNNGGTGTNTGGNNGGSGTGTSKNGWVWENGVEYWYENGVKQGTTGRGKEIYDPATKAWYWLDAVQGGAKTRSKDVYQESDAGVCAENSDGKGKWVRYDANGHMIKGWDTKDGKKYYFDETYGAMVKSSLILDGMCYDFDHTTGELIEEYPTDAPNHYTGWMMVSNAYGIGFYWHENGVLQGIFGRGKEIYDPEMDGWYWLDAVQGGRLTFDKDVYQESLAGEWGDILGDDGQKYGKWVRYDKEGKMVKGWSQKDGNWYYFDKTYGTMAKGWATIDGKRYYFDEKTGILQ